VCLCSIAKRKTKRLTPGELRRVSIAEEIVVGLPLILVDEPISNLDTADAALIMRSLREMVNQKRTVIVTAYQVVSLVIIAHRGGIII
jgi:ABC-type phosphate/phosphonate transport system ATPase subunit